MKHTEDIASPGQDAEARTPLDALPLTISASFTAEPLLPYLSDWATTISKDAQVTLAPYHQVLQQLLDPGSALSSGNASPVVLLRLCDWLRERSDEERRSPAFVQAYLDGVRSELLQGFEAFAQRTSKKTIVALCPESETVPDVADVVSDELAQLRSDLHALGSFQVVDLNEWHGRYNVSLDCVFDPLRESIGHIPYQPAYYDVIAAVLLRTLHGELRKPVKVVVVDCDNTLWDGVVGEVGPQGVLFGRQHRALQQRLAALTEAGVLVALCSKNEEQDVWSVFEQRRTDMCLARDQIVGAAINWQPKSHNIAGLANQLNLGLDSFVFLDDNPVECAEVRSGCPEVLTLEWPTDENRALHLLNQLWELDIPASTAEDRKRTAMYQQEFKRQAVMEQAGSFDEFIEGLELVVDVRPLDERDVARASQLTMRTNQFNFTTHRRTEGEIRALMDDSNYECRTVRVSDRFGDYGLVGLLLVDVGSEEPRVDTFLLSCRVLGRGVEHAMLANAGAFVANAGSETITVELIRTERNTPALNFFTATIPEDRIEARDGSLRAVVSAGELAKTEYRPSSLAGFTETATTQASAKPASGNRHQSTRTRERNLELILDRLDVRDSAASEAAPVPFAADASVESVVYSAFAHFLKRPEEELRQIDDLEALGCESLTIVEITVLLTQRFPELPSTLLFEHASLSAIVSAIEAQEEPRSKDRSHRKRTRPRAPAGTPTVAITGMAIRCGGANTLAEFETLLREGRDAVKPVTPSSRSFLGHLEGGPYYAALLDDADRFDAEFFGVVPREATYMDPQLRHFLEVAWHAIEDAGLAGVRKDPATGVYVGSMYGEYRERANAQARREGSPLRSWEAFSFANRLSQFMGFTGPSLAIDTACSSSGTAIHMAAKAIERGECRVAIAGGMNVIVDADRFRQLSSLGILSANGRCRPFGAEANGTVLGEGVGVVVLRALEDAIADGDQIYGLLRGSALSVGAGSVGFTAPNPVAQSVAIADALADADIDPRSVSYVECHGTGTELGDPIEVRGLELAYEDTDLWQEDIEGLQALTLGSVKANVGHLEAGAGVVSLIKVLLQLRAKTLFPTISSHQSNPKIPLDKLTYQVQQSCEAWKRPMLETNGVETEIPRRAGVNSFGVGGANVHLIVEEYATSGEDECNKPRPGDAMPPCFLPLSAAGPDALVTQALHVASSLEHDTEQRIHDLAYSLATNRPPMPFRAGIVGETAGELRDALTALGQEQAPNKRKTLRNPKLVGLFSGQGSQYPGMGKTLYARSNVFRTVIDQSAAYLDEHRSQALIDVLFASATPDDDAHIHQTAYTQPALFAIEVALFHHFRNLGVEPSLVCGHSVGEIAALCAADAVSLGDGLRLIEARGRLMQGLIGHWGMVALPLGEEEASALISPYGSNASIAAINGPESSVVAAEITTLETLEQQLRDSGIKTTRLSVSHGFHSPQMDPMLDEFRAVVQGIKFRPAAIPLVSCVTGKRLDNEHLSDAYWVQQVRSPVRYYSALESLATTGGNLFLEYGPKPVLLGMGRRAISQSDCRWVPTLTPGKADHVSTTEALAKLFESGIELDWSRILAPHSTRCPTPSYQFTRNRYWLDSATSENTKTRVTPLQDNARIQNYVLRWNKANAPAAGTDEENSTFWLAEDPLVAALRSAGEETAVALGVDDLSGWEQLKSAINGTGNPCIAFAFASDEACEAAPASDDIELLQQNLTDIRRALAVLTTAGKGRLVLVLCTAQSSKEFAVQPARLTALQALGRGIALEHPERWGGIVATSTDPTQWLPLARTLGRGDQREDQWVVSNSGQHHVARLEHAPAQSKQHAVSFDPNEPCMVLGARGAIGRTYCRWLVERGARRLILTSRETPSSVAADDEYYQLEQSGVQIEWHQVDLGQTEQIDRLFTSASATSNTLGAVVHCAGVDNVTPFLDADMSHLREQLGSKVTGGAAIYHAVRRSKPTLVVFNSSMTAVLGSQGRTVYGAANGYLDGIAEQLRGEGLQAISIQWGPWGEGGMARPEDLEHYASLGNHALNPKDALAHLDAAISEGLGSVAVLAMDWGRFSRVYELRRARPILDALRDTTAASNVLPREEAARPWQSKINEQPEHARLGVITQLLEANIAELLGYPSTHGLDRATPFAELGVDSLMSVELHAAIEANFGSVDLSLLFDYDTIESLAQALLDTAPYASCQQDQGPAPHDTASKTTIDTLTIVKRELATAVGLSDPDSIDIQEPLAELGLDSLLMVDVATRLESSLGKVIPLDNVFQQNTTADLASYVGSLGSEATRSTPNEPGAHASPSLKRESIKILGYESGLESRFTEFTAATWLERDPSLAAERFNWMYVKSAERLNTDPRIWRVEENKQFAAFQGSIPVRVKIGDDTKILRWLVDSMVRPEYRRFALGARLLTAARKDFPVNLSLGQSDDMRAIQDRLGFEEICPLTTFVLPIKPQRVLRGKMNPSFVPVVAAGVALSNQARRLALPRARDITVSEVTEFDARFDKLWSELSNDYRCAVVRDSSFLNWKYIDQPGQDFTRLAFEGADGRLVGWTVVKLTSPTEAYPYARATIVDLLSPANSARILYAIFDAVYALALAKEADAIHFHVAHPPTERAAKRYGFFDRGASRFFRIDGEHRLRGEISPTFNAQNWLINMGDSDIDRP
ncbi:MAG: HAD-IIIC family phosphatase [Pseudomonadota bacterium]